MAGVTSHQTVRLSRGKHTAPDHGVCVMELASLLAGEPFTDRPQCASPVVGAFLRAYNDAVGDERRDDLYACAAAVVGTRGSDAVERARVDRCAAALRELEHEPSPVRRWLGRLAGREHVAGRLARALAVRGEDGHLRALAVIEELVALGGGTAPSVSRAAEPAAAR